MNERSYRSSHTAAGYAAEYDGLYAQGYYRQLWDEIESPLLTEVLSTLPSRATMVRALDFACGTGRVTQVISTEFPDCTGVDVSAEMLSAARRRCPDVRFLQADLTMEHDRLAESFDVVTAFRFFLNAEDKLRSEALGAIRQVLVPGGVLIASFQWSSTSPAGALYGLRNRLRGTDSPRTASTAQMVQLFAAHGFQVTAVHRYGLWPRLSRHHGQIGRKGMRIGESLRERVPGLRRAAQNFLIVATNGPLR